MLINIARVAVQFVDFKISKENIRKIIFLNLNNITLIGSFTKGQMCWLMNLMDLLRNKIEKFN